MKIHPKKVLIKYFEYITPEFCSQLTSKSIQVKVGTSNHLGYHNIPFSLTTSDKNTFYLLMTDQNNSVTFGKRRRRKDYTSVIKIKKTLRQYI